MQINAITLGCSDLSRSVAFYERWFDVPASVDGSGVAYFFKQGTPLALFPRDALADYCGVDAHGYGFRAMTLSINLASESAVKEQAQRACDLGAQLMREPGAVDWGGYIAWIGDPDEHLWELVFNPRRTSLSASRPFSDHR